MQQKIVIANDTSTLFTPFDMSHGAPVMATWEAAVPIEWQKAINSSFHKLAHQVRHKDQAVAQWYHDCGYWINHVGPFGDIIFGPLSSARSIMFSAGAVRVQGEAVGFGAMVNAPPTPMLVCGSVPLPLGDATTSTGNSVIVGMDPLLDYLVCWNGVVIEMYIGFQMYGISVALALAALVAAPPAAGAGVLGIILGAVIPTSILDLAANVAPIAGDLLNRQLNPSQRAAEQVRRAGGQPGSGGENGATALGTDSPSTWDQI